MTPVEALEIALQKENNSIEIYRKFSLTYPELKELMFFLINEEEKHKLLIEKKIQEVKCC